jgi:hypothetical protein
MFKRIGFLTVAAYFMLVAAAVAATVHTSPTLSLNSKQTWSLLIGSLVPLFSYVLNYVGPWVSEPVKAFVQVLVAAIAGGLYTALATTSFGWNSATLQMVLTAVIAALAAHGFLWKPSGISTKLGAGSNSPKTHHHLTWQKDSPVPPADPSPK